VNSSGELHQSSFPGANLHMDYVPHIIRGFRKASIHAQQLGSYEKAQTPFYGFAWSYYLNAYMKYQT
jgi:hypothetical protein